MELFLKQIMQVKDMYLKNKTVFILIILNIFFSKAYASSNQEIGNISNYISSLKNFSVSFLQKESGEFSEGKISIGDERVRVDYTSPTKILIVISNNKAMYYNYDLDEDEFFDPRDTSAWFFFEIFNNLDFFVNSPISIHENNIIIKKEGSLNDENYKLKIFFENKPLTIRKIELAIGERELILSFFNHNYFENFNKNYFKLINPSFFDQ